MDGACDGPARERKKRRARSGRAWLSEHPGEDPHQNPLWGAFRGVLRERFGCRCGFLAMWIATGSVDHWVSLRTDRSRAYDWDNYRFVDGAVSSAKKPAWEGKLLDPFEVGDDWFEIQLPSLQLLPTDRIPDEARERADFTLRKLRLRDGEDVIRLRQEWLDLYEARELTLDGLRRLAPLLARAVERRDAAAASSAPPA